MTRFLITVATVFFITGIHAQGIEPVESTISPFPIEEPVRAESLTPRKVAKGCVSFREAARECQLLCPGALFIIEKDETVCTDFLRMPYACYCLH
jgi:hypothetical protein